MAPLDPLSHHGELVDHRLDVLRKWHSLIMALCHEFNSTRSPVTGVALLSLIRIHGDWEERVPGYGLGGAHVRREHREIMSLAEQVTRLGVPAAPLIDLLVHHFSEEEEIVSQS